MTKDIKLFVELPDFSSFSNGTLCLRDLIRIIEDEKIKTIKIFKSNSLKNKIARKFSIADNKSLGDFRKISNDGDWFLACDTTSSYLLDIARRKNLKIIWWQLAPYNFLGNNQIPKIGEYSLPFSSFTDPNAKNYYYYQAEVDQEWSHALEKIKFRKNKKYNRICFYNGKGRLCGLSKDIKNLFPNYDIKIITRLTPKNRSEYFKLLMESDGLISFDQMTQTNLEAASIGLPVFIANPLFPGRCLEKFNIKELKFRMTSSSKEFLNMIKNDNEVFFPFEKSYLESFNKNTLKSFIEVIKGIKELKPLSKDDINNFKKYTKSLKSKRVIFPFINSGQSPSSLLIKSYKKNLMSKRKFPYLNLILSIYDNAGYFLFKLGVIRIIEIFIVKISKLFRK